MRNIEQKGFTTLDILLGLGLAAAIGVAGYFAYTNALSNHSKTDAAGVLVAPKTAITTSPAATSAAVPAGYVLYENKTVGFSFSYPMSWGSLTLGKETLGRITGSFTANTPGADYILMLNKSHNLPSCECDNINANILSYTKKQDVFLVHQFVGADTPIDTARVVGYGTGPKASYLIFTQSSQAPGASMLQGLGTLTNNTDYDAVLIAHIKATPSNEAKNSPSGAQLITIMRTFRELR